MPLHFCQVLAKALRKAAKDKGNLNYTTVQNILGIYDDSGSGNSQYSGRVAQGYEGHHSDDAERGPEVTDVMMLNLAKCFTSEQQLVVLGLRLGLPHHRLQARLCDYRYGVVTAACHVLMEWFHSVPDKKQAYNYLCSALEEANMVFLIEKLTK